MSPYMPPFALAPPDPKLKALLRRYPDSLFSDRIYEACELVELYVLAVSVDVARELEIAPPLGRRALSAEELLAERGFAAAFLPALRWLLARLADASLLFTKGEGRARTYWLKSPLEAQARALLRAALLANDPQHSPTLNLLDAAATTYPKVARGEATGADALFGLGQVALWCEYFHNSNPMYAVNNRLAAIAAAGRFTPATHPRVLEIGAGAGSATEALLSEFAAGSITAESHRVTEPSQFFRRRAERALRAAYPSAALTFGGLDIDQPWREQGIEPGSLNLVYGVNVLHVARDLQFSLRQARTALAPGGWLVIGEAMRPRSGQAMWAEFVFELLDGFTRVETDPELRPTAGFLQPSTWSKALAHAGFEDVAIEPDVAAIHEVYPRFYTGAVGGQRPV